MRRRRSMPTLDYPRVLLVGRDRRYLLDAAQRLRRDGFQVATTCRPCEIADLVNSLDLNIAVVDGSHYLEGTIRSLAAIEEIPTPVAVLTVAEDRLISPLSSDVLPKWGSLARLAEHVRFAFELRPSKWEDDVAYA
jgi:hypothetical protein